MRVAVVVSNFPAISETFVINHVVSLVEAGIEVNVLSYSKSGARHIHPQYVKNNLQEITIYGEDIPASKLARFIRFSKIILKDVLLRKKFRVLKTLNFLKFGKQALNLELFYKAQVLKDQAPFDVIHCHFGPIADDIQRFRELGLITGRLVVSFHGYDFLKKDILKKYKNYERLFKSCDGVIANSSFTKNRLIALGCEAGKIEILPVIPSREVSEPFVRRAEIDSGIFKILTVARLEEVKGVKYGIDAVALLKERYGIPVQYDIIGGGSLMEELSNQIIDLDLSGSVFLHGPKAQDQVVTCYQNADVFLLTSLMETQGLVLIEAQGNGLPVVATRTGGIPDSLVENQTGLLVEVKDVAAMTKALLQLYKDPQLRSSFGEKGKIFVQEKFNAKLVTSNLIAFYQKLLLSTTL